MVINNSLSKAHFPVVVNIVINSGQNIVQCKYRHRKPSEELEGMGGGGGGGKGGDVLGGGVQGVGGRGIAEQREQY